MNLSPLSRPDHQFWRRHITYWTKVRSCNSRKDSERAVSSLAAKTKSRQHECEGQALGMMSRCHNTCAESSFGE